MKPLIIVAGATAVGKTELSIELAERIGGQIISADSMQVYKGMDIGTAKIRPEEMKGIRHYLIDELDPVCDFNVFCFQQRAKACMEQIYEEGQVPIITGGTGFYIQSVLYDIDFQDEEEDKQYRKQLEKEAASGNAGTLYDRLLSLDPDAAAQIHPNNIKRVIRALEYYHATGERISVHNRIQRERKSPYAFCYFVLNRERATIYSMIEKRVDKMIRDGLVDEVKALLLKGIPRSATSMQGLGYKEILSYLDGEISLEEATEQIKKNTRHFAKRQITWFKREPDAVWMNYESFSSKEEMLEEMIRIYKQTVSRLGDVSIS